MGIILAKLRLILVDSGAFIPIIILIPTYLYVIYYKVPVIYLDDFMFRLTENDIILFCFKSIYHDRPLNYEQHSLMFMHKKSQSYKE